MVPARGARYAEVSGQVFDIFRRFTPMVQGLSLDEAFLDVTGSQALFGDGEAIARSIKQAIREARAKGQPIYGETLHQYMLYTSEDYKRENGQIYHTYPSLKESSDQDALWAGQLRGSISSTFASPSSAPCTCSSTAGLRCTG